MGRMKKYTFIIVAAVILLTAGGVSATWQYAISPAEMFEGNIDVDLSVWNYFPPVIEGSGEDHKTLVGNVITDGLNKEGSALNNAIADRANSTDIWGNERVTFSDKDYNAGDSVKDLFCEGTESLTFLVYFPKATPNIRYLFTTAVDMGEESFLFGRSNIPEGEMVYPIYRTTLELKDGVWVETGMEVGGAPSMYYQNSTTGNVIVKTPSFDPANFVVEKRGTDTANAIYTYIHSTLPANSTVQGIEGRKTTTALSDGNAVYYRFNETGARTLRVKDLAAEIVIYDAQGGIITPTIDESNPEFKKYTFTATAGTNYIKITGGGTVTFTLY